MTLSEANVKRIWWVDAKGNVVYDLDVSFGQGIDNIAARYIVDSHPDLRGSGPSGGWIANHLENAVIKHIRDALFPKSK